MHPSLTALTGRARVASLLAAACLAAVSAALVGRVTIPRVGRRRWRRLRRSLATLVRPLGLHIDAGGSRSVTPKLFAAVKKLNELNALLTRAPLDGDEGEMLSHVLSHLKKAHRLPVLSRVRQMVQQDQDATKGDGQLDGQLAQFMPRLPPVGTRLTEASWTLPRPFL